MRLPPLLALLALALAACAPAAPRPSPAASQTLAPETPPAFPRLGAALPAGHTAYDNASLARLFVTLSLDTEWGTPRPNLVRYERPVSVALEGAEAPRYTAFLDAYLAEIHNQTGVSVARRRPANLIVRFVDGARFDSTLRTAACVTAYGDVSWKHYSADPLGRGADALAEARRLTAMTVFIPDNAPPFQVRSCLLEEIPQAMGLVNDLYGLGSSAFNDDGAHIWPTKLDYLMLRVLYAPDMETGLTRSVVEARARSVLDRINPAGIGAPPLPPLHLGDLGDWPRLITRLFSRGTTEAQTRQLAQEALTVVEAYAPGSAQDCFTLMTAGRVLSRHDPAKALAFFDRARDVCDAVHGASDIRHARIALERACALLRLGRARDAVDVAEATWPVLAAHGQDDQLAALYTIEDDALARVAPDSAHARSVARLASEWNDYALGPGHRAAHCKPAA